MSEKLMPFDEFMEALPCCDTVKVILTGCGESVFETKPIYEGICKLANRRAERTGRWIDEGDGYWKCSACSDEMVADAYGDIHPIADCGWIYCPNCGVHMIGGEDDG